jgi:Tfp pilus assembly protein PilF
MGSKRNNTPPSVPTRRLHVWLICICLSAATFAIYAQVLHSEFVRFDDGDYIHANEIVNKGLTREGVAYAFRGGHGANWHPLTTLSHMLDCEIFGADVDDAGGHLMVNVALHAANALLVFLFLRQVTGSLWGSVLVAALFALHPLRVESVAWASERKDVLSGFFFILSLLAYQFYVQRPALKWYLLVVISLGLGLMAKPMLVTLPLVLLLLDLWPLRRWRALPGQVSGANTVGGVRYALQALRYNLRLIVEKIPLLLLAAGATWITVVTQNVGGATSSWGHIALGARVANAAIAGVSYLWKTLWPTCLACFYPHPALVSPDAAQGLLLPGILCGLLLIGFTVLVFRSPSRPYLAIGWSWYLLTLLPVSGVVQFGAQAMADRYTYIPMIGIVVAVVWLLRDVVKARPQWRKVVAATALILLALLMMTSIKQVRVWRGTDSLYRHALAVTHKNVFVHKMYGGFLLEQEAYDRALVQYELALALRSSDADIHEGIGIVYSKMGQLAAAEEHLRQALALGKQDYACHGYLGEVLEQRGDLSAAAEQFRQVIVQKPDLADGYFALARVLDKSGHSEQALAALRELLRLQPDHLGARRERDRILRTLERSDVE